MNDDLVEVLGKLKPSDRRAMLTRDGAGEYSGAVFDRLHALGLVDRNFRFTELGHAAIRELGGGR